MVTLIEGGAGSKISRTITLEFLDFSGVFQDLCLFPGLPRPGNPDILMTGLSRVYMHPESK